MAKVTMTLGTAVESGEKVFTFDYPMVAGHRETFEEKFIDHFYDREINFLSYGQFVRRLRARLNDIMPYYMQLYKSEHLIQNPLQTYQIKESYHREHDLDVLREGASTDMLGENVQARDGRVDDVETHTIGHVHEFGTTDGTLDRDTTGHENQDFKSNEDVVENRKTQSTTNVVGTEDVKEDIAEDTDAHEEFSEDGTKKVKSDMTQDVTYGETTSGNKNTYFSDTPQENFVIGDYDAQGNPISTYATTITRETTTGKKDSTQKTTAQSNEDTTTHTEHDKDNTEHKDTARTQHTDTTQDTDFDENMDRTQNTKFDSNRVTDSEGTQDDVTHGEHETTKDYKEDFSSHGTTSGQQTSDRKAYNVGTNTSKRREDGNIKYTKEYAGYKMHSESEMLAAFRRTFLNIDRMIFDECETLFLGVY